MMRARFIGVVAPQAGCAALALATAALISSMMESGSVAVGSPVAGLKTGCVRPLCDLTSLPPMALWMMSITRGP